jgi:type IV pilus assembly protein PilV
MRRLNLHRHSGVSLIEVMIAVVVLSIGLLGVGTLMAVSLRNTQSAGYRTQAADIAYEFTDIARAYIADGANSQAQLLRRNSFGAPNCNIAAAPGYNCGNDSGALACDIARAARWSHPRQFCPCSRWRYSSCAHSGRVLER